MTAKHTWHQWQVTPQTHASNHRIRHLKRHTVAKAALWLVIGASATLATTHNAVAQTVPATQTSTYSLNIAAGTLDQSLSQLGQQAGIQISTNAELTQGLQTQGLRGQHSVEQALGRLLENTTLEAVINEDGSYSLRKKTVLSLPEITVSASNLSDMDRLPEVIVTAGTLRDGITEGTGSYTQTGPSSTATKLGLTLRETPQSVSVVTRQRMDDQGVEILEDVMAGTAGISMTKDGPNRVAFYARGFSVDSLSTDGLASELSHYISREMNSTPDMAIFDRVEVVRGATGLVQGAGNPSATINLVRKRPTATPQVSTAVTAGSWNNYRAEVDASNALNAEGTLRGRVVAAYQSKESFQDVADAERSVLYAIAEADLGRNTLLTAGISYQNANTTSPWGGLLTARDGSDLGLSRSTYPGNTWDYWDQDNTTLFSQLEHRFDNDWKLSLSASRTWSRTDMLGAQLERIYWVDPEQIGQYVGQYAYDDRQNSYDAYASGPFQWLGRTHELVLGASVRNLRNYGNGNYRDNEVDIDLNNWDPASLAPQEMDLDYWRQYRSTRQQGLYTTARFNATDALKLIVGARLDWFDYDTTTYNGSRSTLSQYAVDRHLTRYAGAIYDLDQRHSVYASYTDIFKPQSQLDAGGQTLKPIVGKNYEIGIKGEYFGGALNASAALFRIDQQNRAKSLDRNACGEGLTSCFEAAGEVRSEGIELEVSGEPLQGWQLGAGYTLADVKYRKDANASNVGQRFDTDLPRQMFKLFTTWQLPGELNRWNVGGGLTWQSEIYNEGTNFYDEGTPFRIEQKAYALASLRVGYRASEHLDVQLSVDNLFDKRYWRAIGANTAYGVNQYGEPRKFTLTARYSF